MNLNQVLSSIHWAPYEDTVFQTFASAVEDYNSRFSDNESEKVSQIAIWTDPRSLTTAINFETLRSADRHKMWCIEESRARGFEDAIAVLESQRYNGSIADFNHALFKECAHPELAGLYGLVTDNLSEREVLFAIERALLRVADRIKFSGMLSNLHSEDTVWIGVNSPDEWYDNVVQVDRRDGI